METNKIQSLSWFLMMIVSVVLIMSILNLYSKNAELHLKNQVLVNDIVITANTYEAMIHYVESVNEELQLREDLTSLIIDAARSYNLDARLLALVIKSESNFRPNPKHSSPDWIGAGGINIKAHKTLKNNPHTYTGNIYASAEILAKYIDDSDSLTLAIARYKGLSPLGLKFAKEIVREYHKEK